MIRVYLVLLIFLSWSVLMSDIVVVGVGNQYRSDDAAGWVVVDRLMSKCGPSIKFVKLRGDIGELMDLFETHKSVYLVDACQGGDPVGAWQRIDLLKQTLPNDNPQTSTHGFGILQAVAMAKNLNQLPEKLIIYLIHGDNYRIAEGISPQVNRGVNGVVEAIINEEEIQSCMNKV